MIRIVMQCYVRSDKAGNGACVSVGGSVEAMRAALAGGDATLADFTKAAIESINAALDTDDCRPMTKAEADEYDADNDAGFTESRTFTAEELKAL